jgi:NAD(P)-dependent dehydrogenase (short-subunit alcohol dehydrogenase family)
MDSKVVIITGTSSAIGEASLYIFFIFIYKITPDQKVDEQQAALLNLTFLYNKTQLQDSLI